MTTESGELPDADFITCGCTGDEAGYSKSLLIAHVRQAIAADRASRQVANKAEVDLSSLTRFGWTEAYIGDTSELVEDAEGTYVKFSDVKEMLATPPATTGASTVLTDEHLRDTEGYKLGWMEGMQEGAELATAGEKTAEDVEAEFADLLPGSYYMDPPDGGSPSVLEQVSRMAEDAAKWREVAAQAGQVAVPEGFVLVPVNPTPKMVDATFNHPRLESESHNARNKRIYAAMLAAAPSPAKESK